MDLKSCSVVYLDSRAREAKTFTNENPPAGSHMGTSGFVSNMSPVDEVDANVHTLLTTFQHVFVYTGGENCSACIKSIDHYPGEDTYTLLIIHVPLEDNDSNDDLGPTDNLPLYGVQFLSHIVAELQSQNKSGVVLPIVLGGRDVSSGEEPSKAWNDEKRTLGALDVLPSPITLPLSGSYMQQLLERAQNVYRKPRKGEYETMTQDLISKLMSDIRGLTHYEQAIVPRLHISHERIGVVARTVGSWNFSTHQFSEDELVYGALIMLQHVLKHPDLERWRLSDEELLKFLTVTRKAYNPTVIYHNFRHACDVLQAVFYFLVIIGVVPPLSEDRAGVNVISCPLASLIRPIDALTLLISAIGHDVGHPGVNNVFLVKVKAAVAQMYNDHSVLESYHCAASSQILRRFWPAAFSDTPMRKMMISSILATDMTLHGQYTARLDELRKKYTPGEINPAEEPEKIQEENRELLCCLIIKCADICNVARRFDIAKDWAGLVTNEFAEQGKLEKEAEIMSCLFGGPPDPTDLPDMAKRQIGFIGIFAYDLFAKMTDVLPGMKFTVDNIKENKMLWQRRLDSHNEPKDAQPFDTPSNGKEQRRGSVKPAQPQEVPNHDYRAQEGYPAQPQISRPSQPLEVPQEDDKAKRPSSGGQAHERVGRQETQHRRSSTRSSLTNTKETQSRRSTGVPTTQAQQLAQASKEPRRGSLGNIAPPKSKDGSPRRSSGRSSAPGTLATHSSPQNLPSIFTSPLWIGMSDSSIPTGDAANDNLPTATSQQPQFDFTYPWTPPKPADTADRALKRTRFDVDSSAQMSVSQGSSQIPHAQSESGSRHLTTQEPHSPGDSKPANIEILSSQLNAASLHHALAAERLDRSDIASEEASQTSSELLGEESASSGIGKPEASDDIGNQTSHG